MEEEEDDDENRKEMGRGGKNTDLMMKNDVVEEMSELIAYNALSCFCAHYKSSSTFLLTQAFLFFCRENGTFEAESQND